MFDLTGKVALVTGASSGIGWGCAKALANQGAKVVVTARRLDKLEALVAEIKSHGKEATAIQMDVTKKEDIQNAVKKTVEIYGRLDILLNNAGVVAWGTLDKTTDEMWSKTIDTNLRGYFWTTQAVVPEMVKNKWGRIINIASIASGGVGTGFAAIAPYCASKGGVVGMTEALAAELAPQGILVNCIGPGVIMSEMTQDILKDPKQAEVFLARVPLKRAGKPEEIAAGVVFLASEEASYTTGATLYIDGGWLAS